MEAQAKEESSWRRSWFQVKPRTGKRSCRWQKIPEWSVAEQLVLVSEMSAHVEADFITLSTYHKWKLISDNCVALGVSRSLNQCRRQWEKLLHEYRLIKDWESQSKGSYWCLSTDSLKKDLKLPLCFDRDLFMFVDENVKALLDDDDDPSAHTDPDFKLISSGIKRKRQRQRDEKRDESVEQKMVREQTKNEEQEEIGVKLCEQAELIHAILKRDTVSSECKEELRRRQANELIKVFGSLVESIEQLSHFVNKGKK